MKIYAQNCLKAIQIICKQVEAFIMTGNGRGGWKRVVPSLRPISPAGVQHYDKTIKRLLVEYYSTLNKATYLHEWEHSIRVVASIKYPPQRMHIKWGFKSFMGLTYCIILWFRTTMKWKCDSKAYQFVPKYQSIQAKVLCFLITKFMYLGGFALFLV